MEVFTATCGLINHSGGMPNALFYNEDRFFMEIQKWLTQ